MSYVGANTGYIISNVDIGANLITKDYLIDAYPTLAEPFRTAGLWTWGQNSYGQIGVNDRIHRSSPVQTATSGSNFWIQITSGNRAVAAIKTDGTLWGWGLNYGGQLADNTTIQRSSPVQVFGGGTNWSQVSMSKSNRLTGAIKSDGTLWMWGGTIAFSIGDNATIVRSSPVQIFGGGTNWKQVACGGSHTGAVKTDGTLWMWGNNNSGCLGNNLVFDGRSSPIQVTGTNWSLIDTGFDRTAAIKTDGTLWTWGVNSSGELGDNSTVNRSSPVQIFGGGTNWKDVKISSSAMAAIKTDGTLWTWGSQSFGFLGDNSPFNKSSPVQTVAGGTNWLSIATGSESCAAIKTDGTLWVWGNNGQGRLGDNSIANKSSPVQTALSGTSWRRVSAGGYNIVGIRDDSDSLL